MRKYKVIFFTGKYWSPRNKKKKNWAYALVVSLEHHTPFEMFDIVIMKIVFLNFYKYLANVYLFLS